MDKLKQIPELLPLCILVVLGGMFFALTNPVTIPPVFFIAGFGFLAIGLFLALRLIARLTGLRERLRPVRYYVLLAAGTALPVMLLALQSIGQLAVRDVLVLAVLFIAGYFYISRMYGKA